MDSPSIQTVRGMIASYSNWGRWGADDEIGTLNFITPDKIVEASKLARTGKVFALAIPLDEAGPQNGGFGRFNPIHLMTRDGNDALANTTPRDFYGGRDAYLRSADDIIIMPLQCGTQWDGLGHIVFEGKIYNGYDASFVSSKGALKNDIARLGNRIVSRGVLLDVARAQEQEWLEPGTVIGGAELEACAKRQKVAVGEGDIVLVRTGQMSQVKSRGSWGDYAAGSAPGLGLDSVAWIHDNRLAAVATDTWGAEVLPNETPDVFQPLHILLVVHLGLTLGEIFDLEELATDCAADGVYEFLFVAPPLPITRAVGSPINPVAVK
ncbi:MAG: cyclase family protein [Candidatus Dormibacteria bacterium]